MHRGKTWPFWQVGIEWLRRWLPLAENLAGVSCGKPQDRRGALSWCGSMGSHWRLCRDKGAISLDADPEVQQYRDRGGRRAAASTETDQKRLWRGWHDHQEDAVVPEASGRHFPLVDLRRWVHHIPTRRTELDRRHVSHLKSSSTLVDTRYCNVVNGLAAIHLAAARSMAATPIEG
jgi:hypothetical protein